MAIPAIATVPRMITLTGTSLSLDEVYGVARLGWGVTISPGVRGPVEACAQAIATATQRGLVTYGVNTGFGSFSEKIILEDNVAELQANLIMSHAIAVGDPLPIDQVRAMMLVRANSLARGYSGVRYEVIETLVALLNRHITPVVPKVGSLACSGDLCLLSHVAMCIIEEGVDKALVWTLYDPAPVVARHELARCGIAPLVLTYKEGLALNNGSTATAAILALMVRDIEDLQISGVAALSLTMNALRAKMDAFDTRIHDKRAFAGQVKFADQVRTLLAGSRFVNGPHLQDSYSVRCAPQKGGPLIEALKATRALLRIELNSVTDNPLIFTGDSGMVALSGGNFDGTPLGSAIETLKVNLAIAATSSERRCAKMLDPAHSNGLPAMLALREGLDSGLMIAQYTAAACLNLIQSLVTPNVTHSTPTSANQEDHNSNAYNALIMLQEIVEQSRHIQAVEVLESVTGLILTGRAQSPKRLGRFAKLALPMLLEAVGPNQRDHYFKENLDACYACMFDGEQPFLEAARRALTKTRGLVLDIPRGTRDFTPAQVLLRQQVMGTVETIFKRHGSVPFDTPVMELREILVGKYGDEERLIFDLDDQGGAKLALRYDLTVPLARYVAMNHITELRRHHIAKVYRRDDPAVERGRYREFYQCDMDIVGSYGPMVADAEMVHLVDEVLRALQLPHCHEIKLNHKGLLDALLLQCGVPVHLTRGVCATIDKSDKLPWEAISQELMTKGLDRGTTARVSEICALRGPPREVLQRLRDHPQCVLSDNQKLSEAISTIADSMLLLTGYLESLGCSSAVVLDLSLARGLDYYTGVIFEAVITSGDSGAPSVGSVCGGGRYDGLIGMFAGKDSPPLPAVGCSFGIERLFTLLESARSTHLPGPTIFVTYSGINPPAGSAPGAVHVPPELQQTIFRTVQHLWSLGYSVGYQMKDTFSNKQFKGLIPRLVQEGTRVLIRITPDNATRGVVQLQPLQAVGGCASHEVPFDKLEVNLKLVLGGSG